MDAQKRHNIKPPKAIDIKGDKVRLGFASDYDENDICKSFLFAVVDEACEMIRQKEEQENMHLPMWLMGHYNQVTKLHAVAEKDNKASITDDKLTCYLEASVQLYEEIEAHLDSASADAIFRKAKNKMLADYHHKSSHQLILLLAATNGSSELK